MSESIAQRLRYASAVLRASFVRSLTPEQAADLATGKPWWYWRRPEQAEPTGVRRWWLILAGRGWGKTRTGAEWIVAKARAHPGARCALVAPTFGDARDTMVEGDSGILSVVFSWELRGGTIDSAWNRSLGELFFANGSHFKIFSSEKPRQLRGPQHHYLWGDEPAYWDDAGRGTARDSTWSNANFGLRLRPRRDWPDAKTFRPQACLTTTPRPVALLKVPDEIAADRPHMAGLLQRPDAVTITRGRTLDNIDNLSDDYKAAVIDPLLGTTLGRQELDAELLEDVEGALWTKALIDVGRVVADAVPSLNKIAVAFDPAGGGGVGHDEHGIVVAGAVGDRRRAEFYVLADYSVNGSVTTAARAAIFAYIEHEADVLVYEKNQGQDWVKATLQSTYDTMVENGEVAPVPLRIVDVSARRSKRLRAEPVAGLYEQGSTNLPPTSRVHHVGYLAVLEGQMTTWIPDEGDSPDRLDALVYAILWLYGEGPGTADVASPAGRERRGRRPNQPTSRLPSVYGYGPGRGG